jgi:RNA polymerase-binding transcription factor DksA
MTTHVSDAPTHRPPDVDELATYRAVLEQQWRHQLADVVDLSYDALGAHNEPDDDGSRATDRLISSRLLAAARKQLEETEAALLRLEEGTFGVCEGCNEQIRPERLEILPATAFCVACQSQRMAR